MKKKNTVIIKKIINTKIGSISNPKFDYFNKYYKKKTYKIHYISGLSITVIQNQTEEVISKYLIRTKYSIYTCIPGKVETSNPKNLRKLKPTIQSCLLAFC